MLLSKKIKIEVSERDAATLEWMQGKCRGLYNWWVMHLRSGERWNFERAKQSLQESKQYDPELRAVYGKLLHEVYFRLDHAMQGFFRRVAKGEKKPGFPRFKPRHQFFTLCYPAMYLDKMEGNTIVLPTGGGGKWGPKRFPDIVAHLTEDPPVHFRRDASTTSAASGATVGTTSNWTRFVPNETSARKNRAATFISPRSTSGLLSTNGANNTTVCIKPPISSHTDWLKGLW